MKSVNICLIDKTMTYSLDDRIDYVGQNFIANFCLCIRLLICTIVNTIIRISDLFVYVVATVYMFYNFYNKMLQQYNKCR